MHRPLVRRRSNLAKRDVVQAKTASLDVLPIEPAADVLEDDLDRLGPRPADGFDRHDGTRDWTSSFSSSLVDGVAMWLR